MMVYFFIFQPHNRGRLPGVDVRGNNEKKNDKEAGSVFVFRLDV